MEKLFQAVSMEEIKPEETVDAVVTSLEVSDVIGMEDAEATFVAAGQSLMSGVATVENAMDIAASLEQQVSVEEAILDAEGATAGIAQLAMVNLQVSAEMLGMDAEPFAISQESMDANPNTALKVSVESAKETLKNVMKRIADVFKKLWQKFKGIVAKAIIGISQYDKKFVALENSLKSAKALKKDDEGKYTDAEATAIAKKFFYDMAMNGGKIDLASGDVSEVLSAGPVIIDKLSTAIKAGETLANLEKILNDNEAKDYKDNFDGTTEGSFAVIARADGMVVSGMGIKLEEVKFGDVTKVKVSASQVKLTGKKDKVKAFADKLEVLSTDDIKKAIVKGAKMASGIKAYAGNVSKSVDGVQSLFNDKGFGIEGDAAKQAASVYATMASQVSTNALKFGNDSLFGYLGELKNLSYLVSVSLSKYASEEEKKDDKKPEDKKDDKKDDKGEGEE